MNSHLHGATHREILVHLSDIALRERRLLPDFPPKTLAEAHQIESERPVAGKDLRDMHGLLWASIDNDDSRDLDQLTVAEPLPDGKTKVLVAIADVDSLVPLASRLDKHAGHNTTSIYTAAKIYPMLPERLSTDLTSLNFNQARLAVVIEMVVDAVGIVTDAHIYRAVVHNHAKLAYNSVAAWLDGDSEPPVAIQRVPGLEDNLRLQNSVAQRLRALRHLHGALNLETIQSKPVFDGDRVIGLEKDRKNCATEIIEDFMIAANGVTARYLEAHGFPSIRRIVRVPDRWDRLVGIAAQMGAELPDAPDSKALAQFLIAQKRADPLRFPDLSLTVIKLLGSGEYVAELPGEEGQGHFGLAVKDYTHSTAPNRRYVDLITQRLLKAALVGSPSPYSIGELEKLAAHCTTAEDEVNKAERQVGKSAAALLLEHRIGEHFEGIVTGAAQKGTWVRLLELPIEGKLVEGYRGVDVGDKIQVVLIATDVFRGHIDLRRARS
ncbi:MAG: RNB domain-containing ribonuclease [Anaerolineae bacterium]|nr:RNB domain-containing ribonuclease [Anaerolineae bacterium]